MDPIRETARFLQRRGLRLATAESCTAGLIASHIADVPGCGGTLQCAIVAYSPEAKKEILGVSAALIERHGLTSEAVSLAMAHGVMKISHANVAVANTGVADDGAPDGTEPGTQCFAWLIRLPAGGATACVHRNTAFSRQPYRYPQGSGRMGAAARSALLRAGNFYGQVAGHPACPYRFPGAANDLQQ